MSGLALVGLEDGPIQQDGMHIRISLDHDGVDLAGIRERSH
jgi:hypothetical protein